MSEYVEETNEYERVLLERAIEAWHEEQEPSGGGAGGLGGGGLPGV